jgi:sugar phosphate isomerase/epimerase
MNCRMDRRSFLKTAGAAGAGMGLAGLGSPGLLAAEPSKGAPNAEKLGWRLACGTWTIRQFPPLYEAIDKIVSFLGLRYIESGMTLRLSKDQPNLALGEDSPADVRTAAKKKLADAGLRIVTHYSRYPLTKDAAQSRKVFEYAKEMGIETLVAEPSEDAFDTIEKLCEEYGINVAIHDHAKPSHYWNPDTVLKVCRGRSERIGACADTGHWTRSGLKPAECVRKLEGRIISFHVKDMNEATLKADEVPWGTGVSDIKGILTEVYRQRLKAVFTIEYEHVWEQSLPDIARSVRFFDQVAAELAAHE